MKIIILCSFSYQLFPFFILPRKIYFHKFRLRSYRFPIILYSVENRGKEVCSSLRSHTVGMNAQYIRTTSPVGVEPPINTE